MKYGLFSLNFDACSYPDTAAKVARAAEATGFDSIWVGERMAAPDPRREGSPVEPTDRMLDPLISLAFLAGQTSQVLLGTAVVVLPQRQPMILAKQLASLDVLSNGRLVLGIGVGYLAPELEAAGVSLRERGARTDEYLTAMRTLWSQDGGSFAGRYVTFNAISAYPHPAGIPILMGGYAATVIRRTVEQGNGWFGFGLDLETTQRHIGELRAMQQRVERPAELGPLEITVSTRGRVDRDLAARFAEAGVDRIVLLMRRHADEDTLLRFVDNAARELLPGS